MLLEAYLKGCGEAMLTRFENQVVMQQCLEEIGKRVSIITASLLDHVIVT